MGATCRGCGKPITWAVMEDGTRVPLDTVPAVYLITRRDDGLVTCKRMKDAAVTHFATCKQASMFSRSAKPEKEGCAP